MTLEQKIGQLFLVSFEGTSLTPEVQSHFEACNFGNYIYFARNLTDYKSIRRLSDDLQRTAVEISGLPAFISIDQEGGMVARAYSGATHFPSAMSLTAADALPFMETIGTYVGRELRALGININHAPVADVNNNPGNPVIGTRSFSDDPKVVAKMVNAYVKGLQSAGVIANAKHFPGHGDTYIDSHLALPMIEHDLDRLERIELFPFIQAISAGIDSIMTAHIIFKAIDHRRPATLSSEVLDGMLRRKLGFEGLIVTDSMSMEAIGKHFTTERGCVMAVAAGADLLCIAAGAEVQARCYNAVLAAVKSGEIPLERIDEAINRIQLYKNKYNIQTPEPLEFYEEHERLADEMSRKSLTLVKSGLFPLDGKKFFTISTPPFRANIADDTLVKLVTLAEKLGKASGNAFAEIPVNPGETDISKIMEVTADYEVIVFASYNAGQFTSQIKLFNTLKDAGKKILLVTLRSPYDFMLMPDADACLAAYEYTNRSVNHVTDAILGKFTPTGKLPVMLKNERR